MPTTLPPRTPRPTFAGLVLATACVLRVILPLKWLRLRMRLRRILTRRNRDSGR
jgi:hypothetical protein